MTRDFTPPGYLSLVAVVHQCVLKAPSGLETDDIAPLLGYKGESAYNVMMAELTQPNRKFDADRLLPAMIVTGSDAPMKFLARHLGGVFIRLPSPADTNVDLVRGLAESVREYGEFAAETAKDISDGDIPADQLARIEKEGDEAIEAIIRMKKLARATHEKQYGGRR